MPQQQKLTVKEDTGLIRTRLLRMPCFPLHKLPALILAEVLFSGRRVCRFLLFPSVPATQHFGLMKVFFVLCHFITSLLSPLCHSSSQGDVRYANFYDQPVHSIHTLTHPERGREGEIEREKEGKEVGLSYAANFFFLLLLLPCLVDDKRYRRRQGCLSACMLVC